MLPWNYGFHWNVGHIILLGAFYCVLAVVAATLIAAARRARQDLLKHHVEHLGWHADFHDLPARDRVCRHVLTGEFQRRECPNAFDCRRCETHAKLMDRHPMAAPEQPERGDGARGISPASSRARSAAGSAAWAAATTTSSSAR